MKTCVLITFLLLLKIIAYGQTKVPSFFGDNMVLQQEKKVPVWGTDVPGQRVSVRTSWGEKVQTLTSAEGKWQVYLQTPSSGGEYDLVIKGSTKLSIQNITIGEVWICSGQSNMEMPVKGYKNQPIIGAQEAIFNSGNNHIRYFHVKRSASLKPLRNVEGQWLMADTNTTGDISAVAYFFGQKLNAILDVPIGLIISSWGASSVEAWMNKEVLQEFGNVVIPSEVSENWPQQTPTALYNGMIHPIEGFSIRGVIWYQGESNRSRAKEYKALFPAMINAWRESWNNNKLPFYFAQIAPFSYRGNVNSAYIRESQLHTMMTVPQTGMAVTLDIGDSLCIHPPRKKEVGERLAYWALANNYGMKNISFSAPLYKSMTVIEDKIKLCFDNVGLGFTSYGKELTTFTIAGDDRVFHPAKARIMNDQTVVVWSEEVKYPRAVRYAFKNWVSGELFNTMGLPVSSFRTDDWSN